MARDRRVEQRTMQLPSILESKTEIDINLQWFYVVLRHIVSSVVLACSCAEYREYRVCRVRIGRRLECITVSVGTTPFMPRYFDIGMLGCILVKNIYTYIAGFS